MKLSVLQWNTWYKEDNRNIAQFLVEQDADVLCLQELTIESGVTDGHGPEYIAKQLGYEYYFKDIDVGNDKLLQANGIFSRYPIVDKKYTWINQPTGTGKYDDEYRALIEVTLDVKGKLITVATTHMSYTHKFEITTRKSRETDVLITELSAHKHSYIFTGDLNAVPRSYTIEQVADCLASADPDYTEPTWTTKPFSYDGFEETKLNWRLDYIFATKDLSVARTGVVQTEYSDHLPIVTIFNL